MRYLILFLFLSLSPFRLHATIKVSSIDTPKLAAGLAFEENQGQCVDIGNKPRPDVLYRAHGRGVGFFLLKDRIVYQYNKKIYPEGFNPSARFELSGDEGKTQRKLLKKIETQIHRMDMVLIGINKDAVIIHEDKTSDYTNYYQGHCPDGILYVPNYKKVVYKNIYKNIDWEIYFCKEGLKYDFIVHPGGNPKDIKFKYEHADEVGLNPSNGNLEIKNRIGHLVEKKPVSSQNEKPIVSSFKDYGSYFGYQIEEYNPKEKLIIDPLVLAWGTLYSRSAGTHILNNGGQMSIDKQGDIYTVGSTESIVGLAVGGFQTIYGGGDKDGFITKTDKNGNRLWVTYYGGSEFDEILTCDIDTNDNLYAAGYSNSSAGIASGGFQNSLSSGGSTDGFLVKFNASGTRIWGTYYGGTGIDAIQSVVVDKIGNVYFSGITTSTSGIASGGFQNTNNGGWDAFLVKLTPACNRIWGTYYGGAGEDNGLGCAVSSQNDVYLSGRTNSDANIASGGFLNTRKSVTVTRDGFLVKFNPNGNRLWGTYYGGTNEEGHIKCVTDISNNVYLFGYTLSGTDIAFNGFQNSGGTGFLVKFDHAGARKWGTYFGGLDDYIRNVRTDKNGFVYITGFTTSSVNIGYKGIKNTRPSQLGFENGFFAKLDSHGNRIWSSYYGSTSGGQVRDCAFDKDNNLFLAVTVGAIGIDTLEFNSYKKYNLTSGSAGLYGEGVVKYIECDTLRDTLSKTICLNDSFYFNDIFRKTAGVYYDSLKNSRGCDSFVTLILTLNQYAQDSIIKIICKGQSYQGYYLSGVYRDTFVGSKCDSIRILNLFIREPDTLHIYDTICKPQSYFFNNQNLTTSGTYRDTFTSSQGCDSFIFLHLYIKDTSYHSFSHITPCDPNASFMFNGLARTQSGVYSAKYLNTLGCDSTAVLNLTIRKPATPSQFEVRLCPGDSFYFGGIQRKDSGDYPLLLTNSLGCDSLITLRLRPLKKPLPESNTIQACSPFSFLGKAYTSSTIVLDTIKSINGNCDSVFRTNIIQLKPPPTTAPEINHIVCDSIRLNNKLYTSSFSFIDTFRTTGTICDSVYRKTNYTIRYTPQIGLKERDTFMRGSQVTLRPFSATNYLWSTGETTKNLSFKLTEDRQLYLIAWNEEPCRDTAYISLIAEDLAIVGMPTGFSPTGEYPENRTLRPNINGLLEYFHLMVFNRWGEKVYETFDTQPLGWNGIFKGEPAPAGLYGYLIEYRTLGSIFNKSGEVMLVR